MWTRGRGLGDKVDFWTCGHVGSGVVDSETRGAQKEIVSSSC